MKASLYSGQRASELLPVLAYSDDEQLFFMEDQSVGFGFLCDPLPGGDESVADRVNVLLNNDWPKDTLLQFGLYASPDIQTDLQRMMGLRHRQSDPLLRASIRKRADFLDGGTVQPIEESTQTQVRNFQLIVTCKLPLESPMPTERELSRASALRASFSQALSTVGFRVTEMTDRNWLAALSAQLNWGKDASWRNPSPIRSEADKPLREQVLDYDRAIKVDSQGLMLGDYRVKTLSFKRLPERIWFGHAASFAGDMMTGSRGLRGSFLLNVTIHFPSAEAMRSRLETKRQWAVNQAYGPMLKFVPVLAAKKKGFDVLFEALQEGDRPIRANMTLTLFSPTEEASISSVSNARTYFKELGFELMEDKYFCLPIFLNALPFGADRQAMNDLFRFKTMATRHVIPLLPLFADWKGTGTPVINFVSRNGQIMSVSLYDSGSNYNCCIAAQSGSGKSFLVNEIISSYLSEGGQCWVIDVGRSYEKLCEVYDGEFLQFGRDSGICLNPFEIVEDYDEEADVLVGLLAAMAAPTQSLTDFQMANLKRQTRELWEKKGRAMLVDDVAEALKNHEDRRVQDVGEQLYPFTTKGEYGRFFNGHNNIRFKNRFTVLELEELKGRKHLQQVVLLQLIYQIQQEMYLGERDRRKIVFIDEAWDLLTQGDVGKFIETGYRRFRKYGGSAVTVTQSVNDLYDSPTGKAIAENSANMYLLGQKAETINALKKEGRLPLGEGGYEYLKTVHTVTGVYSEIFFITEMGTGIGRLIVDPFHKLLYSSRAEDVNAIKQLTRKGLSVADAISQLLKERGYE
ncbi:MAG: type IV secretion system protein TraC [Cycloclasticus sp.]|uniref:type IV secretion system protein TraC n=1 Tax=Cycloclasticus sp. TaxID=2024830 RepID=UPI00257D68F4|nr:type IV secretion system protein TraC [Cycloclasticus sp.]MBV1899283.1 type IV secretion system protein TraC [Cycloclasticus sp.]